jgi:protease-4
VDQLVQVVEAARQDDRIAAVVLEIDSPGGLSTSSEKAFYSLLELRNDKPLVVVVDSIAASGGYYMAVAGNRIYAAPSSFIGNVGVRGPRPFDPQLFPDELSTGPYKLSGGDRFDQIRQLDLLKDAFVGNVVHQRSQSPQNPLRIDAATVAEARLYVGSEALALGLIDAEGSVSDAIRTASELAGVRDYTTQDLLDFLGFDFALEFQEPPLALSEAIGRRLATAPTDAVYFLDSRIPLTPAIDRTALERHLFRLRAAAPALPSSQFHEE